MKKVLFLFAVSFYGLAVQAQNCSQTSVGFPPLTDLGTGTWRGASGGLYPNGSNQRPAAHNAAGLAIARQIQPLNPGGNADTAGKIVWLSIGMSNTTMETSALIPLTDTFRHKNPKLTLIDGAQGGQDINILLNPAAPYWTTVDARLQAAGLTPAQVQIVWFSQAEKNPTDTAFTSYPNALKEKYKTTLQIIRNKYPNVKLCYLSSRNYGGYANTALNPEPFAYYNGWTVKRLIEDQLNGDTALAYSGPAVRTPWLSWGPYTWADGTTPRSDGLTWLCPDDYQQDGTHPSMAGREKVARMLLQFFSTDLTATPWFLQQSPAGVTAIKAPDDNVMLYPQPAQDQLTISFGNAAAIPQSLAVYDFTGRKIQEVKTGNTKDLRLDLSGWPAGMYLLRSETLSRTFIKK